MLDTFTLNLPDGWSNQTAYLMAGPAEGDSAPIVTLTLDRKPTAGDLDEFADSRVAMLEESFGQMEVLKNENITLANGMTAREFIAQLGISDPPQFRKHLWLFQNKVGYDFVGDFTRQTLRTFGIDMVRIAGTLQTD